MGCRLTDKNRREQIVQVTLDLLIEKGFANVSTRDLAERAGLSRSHIYHYFKDWPTLRQEAFSRFADAQLEETRTAVAGLAPREAVEAFIRDCLSTDPGTGMELWLDAWDEALHDPELAAAYAAIDLRWHRLLAAIIVDGVARGDFHCVSPERAARQIFSMTMGYADDVLLSSDAMSAEQAAVEVTEAAALILRGG